LRFANCLLVYDPKRWRTGSCAGKANGAAVRDFRCVV